MKGKSYGERQAEIQEALDVHQRFAERRLRDAAMMRAARRARLRRSRVSMVPLRLVSSQQVLPFDADHRGGDDRCTNTGGEPPTN